MTIISKALAIASTSAVALAMTAAPAQAQVAGVASANSTLAIARAKALGAAFKQIGTQYTTYISQMGDKNKEIQGLLGQLDKNGDKQVDQAEMDAAEKAKSPVLTQIDQKQKEINQLQEPIVKAQVYVVEQIAKQYAPAQEAVAAAKKLNYILAPDAFLWAPESVDVTPAITAELDKRLPVANPVPPSDWQPTQQSFNVYQQVQKLISTAAQVQAARAAQQQSSGQQPSGR